MSDISRVYQALLRASEPPPSDRTHSVEVTLVDTSSTFVPIGFVRVGHEKFSSESEANHYWESCSRDDTFIEPLQGRIEPTDPSRWPEILNVIRKDLKRVGRLNAVTFPEQIDACFSVENACDSCTGHVLLITSAASILYVHWHRES
jgi:hypothetical protein